MFKNPLPLAAFCLFAALVAYYPAVGARLVWDDVIIQTEQVPYLASPADAFFPPRDIPQWAENYYRPLVALTYWAEYRVNARLNGTPHEPGWARLPHANTLALHALCAGLVALLAHALLAGRPSRGVGALAAGLLFAVHPVHAESVAFISGRSDSLATLFLLAALLAAVYADNKRKTALEALSALLFFAALLSKEVALAGIPLFVALKFALRPDKGAWRKPAFWRVPALMAGAALAYFALRSAAGVSLTGGAQADFAGGAWNFFRALGFYAAETLYAWELSPYIPYYPGALATAASLALLALCVAAAYASLKGGRRLPAFFLLWFFAALAPALTLVFYDFSEVAVAERYLYLPSVAFALAAGYALSSLAGGKLKAAALALAALCVFYGATSWGAAGRWGDSLSFWRDMTANPRVARHSLPWQNLADTLQLYGYSEEAEKAYGKALGAEVPIDATGRAMCENGLGQLAFWRGRDALAQGGGAAAVAELQSAEAHFARAVNTGYGDWRHAKNLAEARLLLAETSRGDGAASRRLLEGIGMSLARLETLSPGNPALPELRRRYVELLVTAPKSNLK